MNILIYDDNNDDIKQLVQCIDTYFQKLNIYYNIHICKTTQELYSIVNQYDLLFLDIKINNENGIDIGMKIKSFKKDCRIIITTNYSKYAIDGYKIHADRYFLKPISQKEFDLEVGNIIKTYYKRFLGFYDYKLSYDKIYYHDIIYIEFLGRKTILHMRDNKEINCNYALKYWYDKLKDYGFTYTHKSFIVNMQYISAISQNDIVLFNDKLIPVSRRLKKQFEDCYACYLQQVI